MNNVLLNQLLWPFKSLPNKYVVIDTETTGLFDSEDAPGMISLGAVLVCNNEIHDSAEFLVRPHRPMSAEATKINGISQEQAQLHPSFQKQWPQIASWLQGHLLVIHNASFDWTLLVDHIARYNVKPPSIEGVFCTQRAAQPWAQSMGIPCSQRGPSLDTLSEHLGINNLRNSNQKMHGALIDAKQTAQVVLKLQQLINQ